MLGVLKQFPVLCTPLIPSGRGRGRWTDLWTWTVDGFVDVDVWTCNTKPRTADFLSLFISELRDFHHKLRTT